jgi:hypothetical protein
MRSVAVMSTLSGCGAALQPKPAEEDALVTCATLVRKTSDPVCTQARRALGRFHQGLWAGRRVRIVSGGVIEWLAQQALGVALQGCDLESNNRKLAAFCAHARKAKVTYENRCFKGAPTKAQRMRPGNAEQFLEL